MESADSYFIATKSDVEKTREFFSTLAYLLPHRFSSEEQNETPECIKQFSYHDSKKLLKLEPKLDGTWFLPKYLDEESDTIGFWPPATKFPLSTRILPPDLAPKPPKGPTDILYVKKDIKKFVDAPVLDSPSLSHSAFQNPKKPIKFKNTLHSQMDSFLRKELHEGFLADQLVEISLELFPMIEQEIEDVTNEPRELSTLQCLKTLIMLIGHSVTRDTHIKTAAFVTNSLSIRDKIFANFEVPTKTKNILRGSGFLSPHPFGPMPESLKSSLTSVIGKEVMGRTKSYTPYYTKSKNQNRPYSSPYLRMKNFNFPYQSRDQNYRSAFKTRPFRKPYNNPTGFRKPSLPTKKSGNAKFPNT